MGKWYIGQGKDEFGTNSSFKAMVTPHKEVHDNINKIMKLDPKVDIDKVISLFKDTEKASQELFDYLDSMVNDA